MATVRTERVLITISLLAFLVAILLLLSGCSATKRVLKDPRKTEKVVVEWRKSHPLDTPKISLGTVTVVRDTTIRDTIPLPYPVKHMIREVQFKDRLIRDTIYIRDTAMEALLIRSIKSIEEVLEKMTEDRDQWKQEARAWKGGVIGFFIIAALVVILALVKKFKII